MNGFRIFELILLISDKVLIHKNHFYVAAFVFETLRGTLYTVSSVMLMSIRVGVNNSHTSLFLRSEVVSHLEAHLMVKLVFSEVLAIKLICESLQRTSRSSFTHVSDIHIFSTLLSSNIFVFFPFCFSHLCKKIYCH